MQDNLMSQNIIITEQCSSLRQLGRNALRGKWKNGIEAVILFMICLSLPQLIFDNLFGMNMANFFTNEGFTYNMDPQTYQQVYNSIPQTSLLSAIWVLLISGALMLGLMIYFLASFRGHAVVPKDVFLGFERFGKALGLFLYQYLFIFLWTLLFIVPGIIAAIRYSQAFFVLADDPEKSIRQCMDESKFMMKGNKLKYFLMLLTFVGWIVLAAIPGSLLISSVSTMTDDSTAKIAAELLAQIFLAPVNAYMFSTRAGFYEILAGHLIKETAPAPLSADQISANAPIEKIEEVIEAVETDEVIPAELPGAPETPAEPVSAPAAEALPAAEAVTEPEALPVAESLPTDEINKAATEDTTEERETLPVSEILPEAFDEEDKYHD